MKKLIYTLGIIAAAAFTFSSCQKEQSIDQPSSELVTVTFTAEKAGLDTKTAAVESDTEVSFIWTEEDLANIKLFTVGEGADGKEELTVVANPTITKVSDTKLTIAGKVAPNATYTFRAVLSGKWTNKNHPRLSENQSPSALNYDPTADILISDDKEVLKLVVETMMGKKYSDNVGTVVTVPAENVPDETVQQIRAIAARAYKVLDCEGFARVDFMIENGTGNIYLNEINTIPGFTRFSMFPTLWKAAGVPFTELIERIVGYGYERYNAKNNRETVRR